MYVYVVLPIIFNFTKLKFTLSNLPRITISKNPDQIKNNPHKFPIYWICSAQCLISNARPNKKVLVIYFLFCVTSN